MDKAEYQAKLEMMFEELKKRYAGKELPKTIAELKEANSDIEDIANIGSWIERVYSRHGLEYLVELGLIREKEKKDTAPKFSSLSPEEKLESVTEELKKRVAEDGKRVMASNGKEITENLKALYPDFATLYTSSNCCSDEKYPINLPSIYAFTVGLYVFNTVIKTALNINTKLIIVKNKNLSVRSTLFFPIIKFTPSFFRPT